MTVQRPDDVSAERFGSGYFALGTGFVVLGGLVAAVTGPLELERGSWLAAYLVLVCGVALCVLGKAQTGRAAEPPAARVWWLQLGTWNVGNAAVIIGTLLSRPVVVDVGGALLLVALAVAIRAARRSARAALDVAYQLVLAILIVSIPVGLTLAHLRAG